jgi:Uncharacterised nucleotidyltransferase
MSGWAPSSPGKLFREPRYPAFARAAVRAAACGSAAPLLAELGGEAPAAAATLAAFAVSTQGLSPLLARAPDVRALPPGLADFLAGEAEGSALRAAALRETLVETVIRLREARVEVVALKGAVLAFRDYPDASLRPMGDLDLLLADPSTLGRATQVLAAGGRWRALFDTSRHRVFAAKGERVARPATEDPGNPIRLEMHRSFRLPVLGRWFDASAELRRETETLTLEGVAVTVPAVPATVRHLLLHAAEDFAALGLRGIQAHDFRVLARRLGPLRPRLDAGDLAAGPAPLLYASEAVESLFPGSFDASFLAALGAKVPASRRALAAALPPIRHTRPARGWTKTLLPLIGSPGARLRFLARTLAPSLGELRANAAGDGSIAAAYIRVFARRLETYFSR